MLSVSVCITIQLPKPKSILIVLFSMFNHIDSVGSSNCIISKLSGGDRTERKDIFCL